MRAIDSTAKASFCSHYTKATLLFLLRWALFVASSADFAV